MNVRSVLTYNLLKAYVDTFILPPELVKMQWYAVSRGALPFATMLAVRYNKRFGVVDPQEGWCGPVPDEGPILLIEDVIGSGKSLEAARKILRIHFQSNEVKLLLLIKNEGDHPAEYMLDGRDVYFELPWEPEHNATLSKVGG